MDDQRLTKKEFTEKERRFLDISQRLPIDYAALEALLKEGVDINAENPEENEDVSLLGGAISWFGAFAYCEFDGEAHCEEECDACAHYQPDRFETGKELLKLVRFYIRNGFDVEKYGDECLSNLCYSTGDKWILPIAEELLDNGASVDDPDEEYNEGDAFGTVTWKLGDWMTGAYANGNLMSALCALEYAAAKGKNYHGFRAFDECIGHKVRKVEKLIRSGTPSIARGSSRYNDDLIIWCGELPLYIRKIPELYVNPLAVKEASSTVDVSAEYEEIIGLPVRQLLFIDDTSALIRFDGSDVELLLYYISQPEKKDGFMYAKVVDGSCYTLPEGDVEKFYFQPGHNHSNKKTVFHERRIVLDCQDSVYLLFAEWKAGDVCELRCLKVDKNVCQGQLRMADIGKATDGCPIRDEDGLLEELSYKVGSQRLQIGAFGDPEDSADYAPELCIGLTELDVEIGFGFEGITIVPYSLAKM